MSPIFNLKVLLFSSTLRVMALLEMVSLIFIKIPYQEKLPHYTSQKIRIRTQKGQKLLYNIN